MANIHVFLLFAVLATLTLAAPTRRSALAKRSSFTVPRVRNLNYVRNPATAMNRAYRKFGWQRSSNDSSATSSYANVSDNSPSAVNYVASAVDLAAASTTSSTSTSSTFESGEETGSVSATSGDNGAEYLSPVTIGGQTLNLDFDTGSADLWVFSTYLPSSELGNHTAFNPSESSTFKKLTGYTFELSYGDGSGASGTVGTDTVNIGGATVTGQAIELATAVSSEFVKDVDSDGLVGFAFSSINAVSPKQQTTFYQSIMSSLEQPVFTADLDEDGSGTYGFGVIDSSKYTGNLTFTSIDTSSGYWQFDSNSYTIDGVTTTRSSASPAIADTGTSLVLVDPAVAKAYYAQITGSEIDDTVGGYVYPCSADLPSFGVAVGDYMATIPGSGMTYAEVNEKTCFGSVQSNSGSDLQIFGDALLKYNFVVFDGENEVLGMASKA